MITQKELKEWVSYNPNTGCFIALKKSKRRNVGEISGGINGRGYVCISILGKKYLAHRLAFLHMNGEFPKYMVDHINRITHDNRWDNLRDVSQSQNQKNTKLASNNTSGIVGVSYSNGRWNSHMTSEGKAIKLGSSKDFFEACCARKSAEIKHSFHENHGT